MKKLISVFGPSGAQPGDHIYTEAEILGQLLAEHGYGIVCGGYDGVMEAVSRGAASRGAGVAGVTADVYAGRGRTMNEYITREVKVKSAIDRLMELVDLGDAYVAIGISPGTLLEVAAAWEMMAKKFIEVKPLVLIGDEWRALCDVLLTQEWYIGKTRCVNIVDTPEEAIERLHLKFGIEEPLPDLPVVSLAEV